MKLVQISYRKIIGVDSPGLWEKYVFDDTYREFLMQFQFYNAGNRYKTFSGLLADQSAAEKMQFLVGSAAMGYIAQLHNRIPDVQNTLGKTFLPFQHYRFEIIDSHILKKEQHRVAICFYSEPVQWIETIGECMLLSLQPQQDNMEENSIIHTEMLRLQPFISIHAVQSVLK